MKKRIRLTENELIDLLKNVIDEQQLVDVSKYRDALNNSRAFTYCQTRGNDALKKAVKWWKDWLNHPVTKQKYEKLNEDKFLNGMWEVYHPRWIRLLDLVKLVPYDKKTQSVKNGLEDYELERKEKDANAFVISDNPYTVFYNCDSKSDPVRTMIHELQHALNQIHPLNPQEKVENLMSRTSPAWTLWNNLQRYINELGYDIVIPESLKKTFPNDYEMVFNWWKKKDEVEYTCSWNENLSRLYSIRKLFNITPAQNITFAMIRPYIVGDLRDSNMGWLLRCWGYNGFQPIEEYLSGLNSFAKNKLKPSNQV